MTDELIADTLETLSHDATDLMRSFRKANLPPFLDYSDIEVLRQGLTHYKKIFETAHTLKVVNLDNPGRGMWTGLNAEIDAMGCLISFRPHKQIFPGHVRKSERFDIAKGNLPGFFRNAAHFILNRISSRPGAQNNPDPEDRFSMAWL